MIWKQDFLENFLSHVHAISFLKKKNCIAIQIKLHNILKTRFQVVV